MKEKMKYIIPLTLILAIIIILVLNINNKEKLISGTQYIEIQIEDTEAQGLAHTTPVKITEESIIRKLEKQVNNGIEYEPRSTAWPDISPLITFYLENGEKYCIFQVCTGRNR